MSAVLSVGRLSDARRHGTIAVAVVSAIGIAIGGVWAAGLSMDGRTLVVIGLGLAMLPLILRRWPEAGVVILVAAATVIEQLTIPLWQWFGGIGSDEILYFTSLNDGANVAGVLATPLELTMAMILLLWLIRGTATHTLHFRKSELAVLFGVLFAVVLVGAARGIAQGADLRTDLREVRPWVYLTAGYLIASQLLNGRRALQAVLWPLVLGVGFKGIQGTYRFFQLLEWHPRPDFIISHEEAFFLTLFILLTAGLWIFSERGALRRVATALLPFVFLADLANARRTAWMILGAGLAVLLVVAWIRLPERRTLLKRLSVGLVLGSLIYIPVFWSSTAVWAEPARAIRSAFTPSERDKESNIYRKFENANLMADIKITFPLGQGFGIPIDYSAIPFHDLSDSIPALRFVPHDGILYVWMEMGIPGAIAFWWLVGAAFVLGCRVALAADRRIALFGAFVVCALIAYLLEGYYDFGLWFFRVAVLMGCLLGALEAANREATRLEPAPDPLRKTAVGGHQEAGTLAGVQQPRTAR